MSSVPSVGRIVHYVSHGTPPRNDGTQAYTSQCRAAIITEANHPQKPIGLAVLNPTGIHFNRAVPYSEDHEGGSWHWPERVPSPENNTTH